MRRAILLVGLAGCVAELGPAQILAPDPNPILADDPLFTPQPRRERPRAVCVAPARRRAFVTLAGTEDEPGTALAIVDLDGPGLAGRLELGPSPYGCALDPSGRYLAVTLRYQDRAMVIDVESLEVVGELAVPFYTEGVLWAPDGRLWFANRWTDSVFSRAVSTSPRFSVEDAEVGPFQPPYGTPVGENPGPLALSEDGARLFVGLVAGAALAVVDARTGEPIDADGDPDTTSRGAPPGVSRIELFSPVGGLAVAGRFLFVADIGRGAGSEAAEGLDLDDDGRPGDGTANVVFQDLQNELAVYDTETFAELHRYTSDSICCGDFRDVDPDRPERGLALPAPDTWGPAAALPMPARDRWIVGGALPEALAIAGRRLAVAYAGSNEVQRFAIAADGALAAEDAPGRLLPTGLNPKALAYAGDDLVVVNRLGESLTVFPAAGPPRELVVGDVRGGAFPATDAELGEAINELSAAFTIDGDQTCVHCHRDNGAIARPVVMPLQLDRGRSARSVMAQRGLYDTRPWFFESAMGETNFFPVLNEFARKENFCCEQLDPTVWSRYPALEVCRASPSTPGCNHVLDCDADPPPECAARPYARDAPLRRTTFILAAARRLFGRERTFGDALHEPAGPNGEARPIRLDFEGVTRAVGLFMLRTPRLLPNPNRALGAASVARGRRIYEDARTGCGLCHPLPITTTASRPTPFSPAGMPVRFPPVVSPMRGPSGENASLVTAGFLATFPETLQGPPGLYLGATPLRGLWDRPRTRLLHDGRARSLMEVLATPGHPALGSGELGRNERDGMVDTHGGTSHLDPYELADLIAFLETL